MDANSCGEIANFTDDIHRTGTGNRFPPQHEFTRREFLIRSGLNLAEMVFLTSLLQRAGLPLVTTNVVSSIQSTSAPVTASYQQLESSTKVKRLLSTPEKMQSIIERVRGKIPTDEATRIEQTQKTFYSPPDVADYNDLFDRFPNIDRLDVEILNVPAINPYMSQILVPFPWGQEIRSFFRNFCGYLSGLASKVYGPPSREALIWTLNDPKNVPIYPHIPLPGYEGALGFYVQYIGHVPEFPVVPPGIYVNFGVEDPLSNLAHEFSHMWLGGDGQEYWDNEGYNSHNIVDLLPLALALDLGYKIDFTTGEVHWVTEGEDYYYFDPAIQSPEARLYYQDKNCFNRMPD